MEDLACAIHATPQTLPDELVYHILRYTSPRELIRLRLVSKQFNDVARDTQLWKALYATARLPRPPGPFSWQSTRSLERILVPSECLSRTWTSQPLKVVSITQGPSHRPIDTPNILFGRLFIWSGVKQVFAEDLEVGSRQMIWETDKQIRSFRVSSVGFPDALRVYLVVCCISELGPPVRTHPFKLVVFSLQDETTSFGPVIHEMDLPENARLQFAFPPLYFDCGSSMSQYMFVDPWTYTIYRSPIFNSNLLDPAGTYPDKLHEILATGPYRVSLWKNRRVSAVLVRIFVVPDQPHPVDGDLELRLTHEALIDYVPYLSHILRDPVVNPLTGDTILRFFAHSGDVSGRSRYYYVDFTLPAIASNSTEILSLAVTYQELFELRLNGGILHASDLQASSDGYARGLCVLKSFSISEPISLSEHIPLSEHIINIHKFSIDANGEECTAMVSDIFENLDVRHLNMFDGVRGRICYSREEREDDSTDLVVFDFQ